jgi:hypothetical protein
MLQSSDGRSDSFLQPAPISSSMASASHGPSPRETFMAQVLLIACLESPNLMIAEDGVVRDPETTCSELYSCSLSHLST